MMQGSFSLIVIVRWLTHALRRGTVIMKYVRIGSCCWEYYYENGGKILKTTIYSNRTDDQKDFICDEDFIELMIILVMCYLIRSAENVKNGYIE